MKFICEKALLDEAVTACSFAVPSRATTPALEGILINAGEGVTMTSYNYRTGVRTWFPAAVETPGSFILPAKRLLSIMRSLPDGQITLEIGEDLSYTLSQDVSVFQGMAISAKEFPDLPNVDKYESFEIKSSLLRQMIGDVIFAISENESRPITTGALFELKDGRLTLVAVDGYRLSIRTETPEKSEGDFSFVVPGEALKIIMRMLPENDKPVEVYPRRKHALFQFANTAITTRLLEGEFIDYRNTVKVDNPIKLRISTETMLKTIEKVSVINDDRIKSPLKLMLHDDTMTFSCTTPTERTRDVINIPSCKTDIEIGFNNRYLYEAVKAVHADSFVFHLKSHLTPVLITHPENDSYVCLVLPVRLKTGE